MKAILGFTRMSVRGLNKVKRELGFVLMALNIRKVVAQRAENNQKFIKRQFLYYFNRNCLFHLSKNFMSRTLYITNIIFYVPVRFFFNVFNLFLSHPSLHLIIAFKIHYIFSWKLIKKSLTISDKSVLNFLPYPSFSYLALNL